MSVEGVVTSTQTGGSSHIEEHTSVVMLIQVSKDKLAQPYSYSMNVTFWETTTNTEQQKRNERREVSFIICEWERREEGMFTNITFVVIGK